MSLTIEYLWKDRKRYFGLPLSFTRYCLSDDRLFVSVGLLNIKDDEILLYRVRDIDTVRTLWQRLFGVGTVTVVSSDKTMPKPTYSRSSFPHTRPSAVPAFPLSGHSFRYPAEHCQCRSAKKQSEYPHPC